MKRMILCILLGLGCFYSRSQDTIVNRIVLVGDAGAMINGQHPVALGIKKHIPLDKRTLIVYLGDNLYKEGLPDEAYIGYAEARAVLDSQLAIVENTAARIIMIPGNHDWNNGGRQGYQAILREQNYVNLLGKENVKYYPVDGCPGPVEIQLSPDVVLVVFDSQWFLHPYDKPGIESDCPYKTRTEVLTQMSDIFTKNARKLVILACHHPFKSTGIHGGYFSLKQHIFPFTDKWKNLYLPLPLLGSVYPISRSVFGSPQDIPHPVYQNMIRDVEAIAKTHPNVIFTAGHDHNLQMIKDDSNYHYITSGSGSKLSRVARSKNTVYRAMEHGFATIEVSTNKNVRVQFYITQVDSLKKDFDSSIFNFAKAPEQLVDSSKKQEQVVNAIIKDTVNVPASKQYGNAGALQRWVLGNNYRKEWSTPVNMKVFHINKEKGGFKITGMGGGKQTKSLRLEDKDGREWTLRTIDKDPEAAVPENLRNSFAEELVQDMISAAHPYAPLAIPDLAKATNIPVPRPEIFFVPDDPALGFYQRIFANTVCLLEERDPTLDRTESRSTAKVLQSVVGDNDHVVQQDAVLKARLLDMLIGDWDRHFDQWKWGTIDTGKGKLYYPIPRDRDQAFFNSDGLLLWYASQQQVPFLKGFRKNIARVGWFNFSARDFDRIFLNALPASAWRNTISKFQSQLTDDVIESAVNKMPAEVVSFSGPSIIKKLKSRRDNMMKKGMQYYKFISDHVNIVGTNEREYFHVYNVDTGLRVVVYGRNDKVDTGFKMFDRTFNVGETDELRLYGLNGNDLFYVDENAKSKVKLRIIGGKGNDTFNIKGHVRNLIYDMKDSVNHVLSTNNTRMRMSTNPSVNDFDWVEYRYNEYRYPRITAAFNPEDGVLVGAGFSRRSYGFRREPYATDQRLGVLYAPNRGAYRVRYTGDFIKVFGNNDLVLRGELVNPTLNNFFGLGNNTEIEEGRGIEYYRARFKYVEADALLRLRVSEALKVAIGPTYYKYWYDPKDNRNKILERPSLVLLDSMGVYSEKSYLGAKAVIEINNLNSELFPTRGIQWTTDFTSMAGMTSNSRNITRFNSDMAVYASLSYPAKLVALLRFGGGHIFGNEFEYFQAMNLGANNFLRGFRKNRFSGRSLAYNSIELRARLFRSRSYIFPGDVGVVAFHDIGRVWMNNDPSRRWHNAYGGGIYYVPFNMVIVSATMAFSREENLFNISAGTRINITF